MAIHQESKMFKVGCSERYSETINFGGLTRMVWPQTNISKESDHTKKLYSKTNNRYAEFCVQKIYQFVRSPAVVRYAVTINWFYSRGRHKSALHSGKWASGDLRLDSFELFVCLFDLLLCKWWVIVQKYNNIVLWTILKICWGYALIFMIACIPKNGLPSK